MKTLFTIALVLVSALSIFGQSKLTNKDIVEMVNAGIAESVIISKIKATDAEFQTDLEGLKALKEAKVPESVVSAMIEKGGTKTENKTENNPVWAPLRAGKFVAQPSPDTSRATEKERFKQPASVRIGASPEVVMKAVIQVLQSANYQLDSESGRRLLMSKEVPGTFRSALMGSAMGGRDPRYQIQATVVESEEYSTLTLNAAVVALNNFGRPNASSLDKNKDVRRTMDEMMLTIKLVAETEMQAKESGKP